MAKARQSKIPEDIVKMTFEKALTELESIVQKLEGGDVGPADAIGGGQFFAQRLWNILHGIETGHAAIIEPVPELLGAERLLPERHHLLGELLARETDQWAPVVGRRVFG